MPLLTEEHKALLHHCAPLISFFEFLLVREKTRRPSLDEAVRRLTILYSEVFPNTQECVPTADLEGANIERYNTLLASSPIRQVDVRDAFKVMERSLLLGVRKSDRLHLESMDVFLKGMLKCISDITPSISMSSCEVFTDTDLQSKLGTFTHVLNCSGKEMQLPFMQPDTHFSLGQDFQWHPSPLSTSSQVHHQTPINGVIPRSKLEEDPFLYALQPCIGFIRSIVMHGGKVLVYSQHGFGRAAALVTAFLMDTFALPYMEAFSYVAQVMLSIVTV